MKPYLSVEQASNLFNIHEQQIINLIIHNDIDYIIHNNQYRVDFDSMLAHNKKIAEKESDFFDNSCANA